MNAPLPLRGGKKLPAQLGVLGVGTRVKEAPARNASLEIGPTGGVAVDRSTATADPAICACGDGAKKVSLWGGQPSTLKLASIAQFEARVAGANGFDRRRENEGTVGAWSTMVDGWVLGTAGLTESIAHTRGYNVISGTCETPDRHPAGMPGSAKMKTKLVFEAHTRELPGGQVRGVVAAGGRHIGVCPPGRIFDPPR